MSILRRICTLDFRSFRKRGPRSNAPKAIYLEALEDRPMFSFFTASPINLVGLVPVAATNADLRGIGRQDVIVANADSNNISILLGNGDGTFQPAASYSTPAFPEAVHTADINGDGHLDIVVANGNNLTVFLGDGTGTFGTGVTTALGVTTNSLAIADFNKDGKPDVVANNLLLLGNGDGTFQAPTAIAANILGVTTADMNGDGKPDLVASTSATASGAAGVSILLGNGDGTFQSPAVYANPGVSSSPLVVADLNGDGILDVAVNGDQDARTLKGGIAEPGTVSIFLGNADGTLQPGIKYSVGDGPSSIVAADVNGDGINDLVIGGSDNNLVFMLQGRAGAAPATPVTLAPGTQLTAGLVVAADFNGDGHTDLGVVSNGPAGQSGEFTVVLSNPDGTLAAPEGFTSNPGGFPSALSGIVPTTEGLVAGDFNGDGKLDLAVENVTGFAAPVSETDIMLGNGDGTFQPATEITSTFSSGAILTSGDLNGDGQLDLVVATATGINVLYGNGDGTFHAPATYALGQVGAINGLLIQDVTGDGIPDLVERATVAPAVVTQTFVFAGKPDGTLQSPVAVNNSTVASLTFAKNGDATADFNGDGIPDLVLGANGENSVFLGLGDGATTFGGTLALGDLPNLDGFRSTNFGSVADPIAVGDFNGDGTPDIAAGVFGQETISIALNSPAWPLQLNGTVGFKITPVGPVVAGQPASIQVTAVDANGNVDPHFQGTVSLDFANPGQPSGLGDEYLFSAADNGTHVFTRSEFLVTGQGTLTVRTLGLSPSSAPVTVVPGPVTKFVLTSSGTSVVGSASSLTVIPEDGEGNPIPNYTGTVHFTETDPTAVLPPDYTFTAADAGKHTFQISVTQTSSIVSVSDTATGAITRNAFEAAPLPPVQVVIGAIAPSAAFAGQGNTFTVTTLDKFGNVSTGYSGILHFSSSDPLAILPPSLNISHGVASANIVLKTAGTQTVSITDSLTGVTTTQSILVVPWVFAGVTMTGTPTASAGSSYALTVSAVDAFGNVETNGGFSGTIRFSGSDLSTVLPPDYTMTFADQGTHTFQITFTDPVAQSVRAFVDNGAGTAIAATLSVAVVPGPLASFSVTSAAAATAGVAQSFTVTAKDSVGNIIPNYTGIVKFSSSDVQAGLPGAYTFTAADAGTHTFSATLKTSGAQSLVVTDPSAGISSADSGISVAAGAAIRFVLSGPATATSGKTTAITVTAVDAFGNIATGYRGKVHFTDTLAAGLPSDYTFNATDNGVHTFNITFNTAGLQTLKLADTLLASVTGSFAITDAAAASGGATGGGGGGGGGGGSGGGKTA